MAARLCDARRRFAPAVALGSLLWFALSTHVMGQQPAAATVPLARVVLFNSGVGFFEHRGEIEGDARVELKFNVDDINDLLKSMVLQDLGGGRVSTVTYGSKDPFTKTLKTFAIDLTENPTVATILEQIRGERIVIAAPDDIEGTILGVETRNIPAGKDQSVEVDFLNLLTDDGLRSMSLANVGRIKLLNKELDGELRAALALLASSHVNDKKSVSLDFLGQGRRLVRLGYIQEAPIWKTSYRLVLAEDGSTHLQGWAIVENTTEGDWDGVQLTLVSGRPISFQMNLYEPLYVKRQMVEPELYGSLRPQTYEQDLKRTLERTELKEQNKGRVDEFETRLELKVEQTQEVHNPAGAPQADFDSLIELITDTISPDAQASDVGELFQYAIDTPVKLPRQQSAMLPIVNGPVEAEKVSIYNAAVQPKHPLNGLQLTNTSGLHFMQGPITVFDGGSYAGDAQMQDLPPGAKRLVSYALDLDVEVVPESQPAPQQLTSVKIVGGVLEAQSKYLRETRYTVKNNAVKARNVLVEQPVDQAWTLLEPKEPEEKTRSAYRFAVAVEPGQSSLLAVREEMVQNQTFELLKLEDDALRFYLDAAAVSQKVKQALVELARRRHEIAEVVAQRKAAEAQIDEIGKLQERVRKNMSELDRTSELYKRYVKDLSTQEDQIVELRQRIATQKAKEQELQKALGEYLSGLETE